MVKKTILAVVAICFIAISCKKEAANAPSVKSPVWENFVKQNGAKLENFAIDANNGGEIITKGKTKFAIPAQAFVFENNAPVTGDVTFTVQEFNSVAKLMLHDKQTMTTDNQLLDSWGTFTVSASQEGKPLKLRDGVAIKASKKFVADNKVTKNEVQNWIAEPYQNSVAWRLMQENVRNNTAAFRDGETLEMYIRVMGGQYNFDYPMGGGLAATATVNTITPQGRLENIGIFFVPDDSRGALKFFDTGRNFETPPAIPAGLRGTVIAFATIGDRFFATQQGSNPRLQFTLNLTEVTEDDLVVLLRNLDDRRNFTD
jgi:hypothetical protein